MSLSPETLLELQTTAVVLVDGEIAVLYLNAAAEDLLQIGRDRLIGQPLVCVLPLTETALDHCREVQGTEQAFTQRREQFQLATDRMLTLDYTVTPVTDSNALLIELHSLDRILRIDADDRLFSEMETTRKLVRGLAHEIKNPLGGIRGAAQLLERELATDEFRDYTQVIITEADRLVTLIDRMVGPSQLPNYTATNIHELLERVVRVVSAEAGGDWIVVRDYDVSLPDLELDGDQIHQALLNIIRNCFQALAETKDGRVTISTSIQRQFTIGEKRHRQVVVVRVNDNGPGIPAELADRIFYPMISGRANGTGLGLAIAQAIIGQHGGLIEANSVPGDTVFSIYLPICSPGCSSIQSQKGKIT